MSVKLHQQSSFLKTFLEYHFPNWPPVEIVQQLPRCEMNDVWYHDFELLLGFIKTKTTKLSKCSVVDSFVVDMTAFFLSLVAINLVNSLHYANEKIKLQILASVASICNMYLFYHSKAKQTKYFFDFTECISWHTCLPTRRIQIYSNSTKIKYSSEGWSQSHPNSFQLSPFFWESEQWLHQVPQKILPPIMTQLKFLLAPLNKQ